MMSIGVEENDELLDPHLLFILRLSQLSLPPEDLLLQIDSTSADILSVSFNETWAESTASPLQ